METTTTDIYEQMTEHPAITMYDTPGTSAITTIFPATTTPVSDNGSSLETTYSSSDIGISTEASHFSPETTHTARDSEHLNDEKPFYERTYFVVIAVTISSIVAVLLLCLYCFVVALCWKSKKAHRM